VCRTARSLALASLWLTRAATRPAASVSGLPRNPFYAGAGAKLDLGVCLGPWWTAPDDAEIDSAAIFVRLAFENLLSQCGGLCECLVRKRRTVSGNR
jgi:hypothetical protein